MNPDISIIVPAYNSEEYISQCLKSLISQTHKNIEIICVNDGSDDNTLEIIKEFVKLDDRIILIDQKNSGQGVARNKAMDIAKGKYIMFMDSDDWLKKDACELLFDKIESDNVDLVYFNATYYNVKTNKKSLFTRIKPLYDINGSKVFKVSDNYKYCTNQSREAWFKIYRKEFLDLHNIRFSVDRRGEDTPFWIDLLLANPKASILYKELYYYRVGIESSVSATGNNYIKIFSKLYPKIIKQILNSDLSEENKEFFIASQVNWFIYWTTYRYTKKQLKYNEAIRRKLNKVLFEYYGKEKLLTFITNSRFWDDYRDVSLRWHIKKFFAKIFSIKNQDTKTKKYKVFTLFGIKIKFQINKYGKTFKNYKVILKDLSNKAQNGKIRVGFLVDERSKWKAQTVYNELEKDEHFSPCILVTRGYGAWNVQNEQTLEDFHATIDFFKSKNCEVIVVYDEKNDKYLDLSELDPHIDILFYQHPWEWYPKQDIKHMCKYALTCYIPYFVATSNFTGEYNRIMHRLLYRHYLISNKVKKQYEKLLGCKLPNIKIVGHPILEEIQKNLTNIKHDKKCVIYAPHWSIGNRGNDLHWGTFEWSGDFMLDYAKKHPEYKWIFKPHPVLKKRLTLCNIMSEEEVERYYNEWSKIATVSEDSNYIDLFSESDLMITDCGSFLTEYGITLKPIIHLLSGNGVKYNYFVDKLTKTYYQVSNEEELVEKLELLLVKNKDPQKDKRIKVLNGFKLINNNSSINIVNDLKEVIKIKD